MTSLTFYGGAGEVGGNKICARPAEDRREHRPKKVMSVHTESPEPYAKFIEKLGFGLELPMVGHALTI
jgi:hypothetical protein